MDNTQKTITLKGITSCIDGTIISVGPEHIIRSLPKKLSQIPVEKLTHIFGLDWSNGPLKGILLTQTLPQLPHFQVLYIVDAESRPVKC